VRTEVDIRNLRTIFRLKREKGMRKEQVMKYMILPGGHLGRDDLTVLASADEAELAPALGRTRYGPALGDSLKAYGGTGSLAPVQAALEKYWLRQIGLMFHQNPLSINPIIGYVLAKEREYKNVRLVAHAKGAGLPKEFITENIIA
jgi:vacuolar-type H+-ATPase subunit C/Vma6